MKSMREVCGFSQTQCPEMEKITKYCDFENQNQITTKTVILKSKSDPINW